MNFKSLYQKGRKKDGNKRLNEKTVVNYLEQRAMEGPESGTVKKQPLGTCFSNFVKNFAIFTGKHLCRSLFLITLQVFKSQHRCFYVNTAKCLRAPFLQNTYRWLLLTVTLPEVLVYRLLKISTPFSKQKYIEWQSVFAKTNPLKQRGNIFWNFVKNGINRHN